MGNIIEQLKGKLNAGDKEALREFIEMLKEKGTPLVENINEDSEKSEVTFIYEDDSMGDGVGNVLFFPGFKYSEKEFDLRNYPMEKIQGTNIWYRTFEVKNDVKFIYHFFPDDSLEKNCKDRWGKRKWDKYGREKKVHPGYGGKDKVIISHCSMPKAKKDKWTRKASDGKCGRILEYVFNSERMVGARKIRIYVPHGYDKKMAYPLLLCTDGREHIESLGAAHALNNLINEGKVKPLIGVFIDSTDTRPTDLRCNDEFCKGIVEDLIPWVNEKYKLSHEPTENVVCGYSLGGLTAAYMGLKYPNIFGTVLAQSGSFWYEPEEWRKSNEYSQMQGNTDSWMSIQYKKGEKLPLKFYINVGELESVSMNRNIRNFKDTLIDSGYDVTFETFKSGHDFLSWGESFAEGMKALKELGTVNKN